MAMKAQPPRLTSGSWSAMAQPAELKKVGLKATVPRLRILAILESHRDSHMSSEDVYRALLDAGETFDLAILDPSGTELDSDYLPDPQPVLILSAMERGRYQVRVEMAACSLEPKRTTLLCEPVRDLK